MYFDEWTTTVCGKNPCHGCNGKGWVEVGEPIIQNDIYGKAHIVK
jgi:hypothetical protein